MMDSNKEKLTLGKMNESSDWNHCMKGSGNPLFQASICAPIAENPPMLANSGASYRRTQDAHPTSDLHVYKDVEGFEDYENG